SLADRSTHPISQAISRYADRLEIDRFVVDAFKTTPGAGTQGRINGSFIRMVSPRAFTAMGELPAEIQKDVETYQAQGASVVLMADFFGVCGLIAVADRLREEAKGAIEALEQMGVTTVLITGDNQATARHMAELVGIKTVHAEMLPEDKLAVIETMQKDGLVAMVGDGINDAPALAQADIGMAMAAGGSEIAVDAANVALMDDDVAKIATLIKLSQMTHNRLVQNIVMALGVKFIFMVMTFMGMATMWMAVFADIGICLIVVAWGMALLGAEKTLRH
ncbi:MAG: cation-translocating P-type ATPase, partial [Burkholderiaceae bacterium]|nr:cation-translocating P-type ATPase [Burkholderiaceae bacterium]